MHLCNKCHLISTELDIITLYNQLYGIDFVGQNVGAHREELMLEYRLISAFIQEPPCSKKPKKAPKEPEKAPENTLEHIAFVIEDSSHLRNIFELITKHKSSESRKCPSNSEHATALLEFWCSHFESLVYF